MRRDGWPRCPWWAEALTAVMWHGLNLTAPLRGRLERAVERWDRRVCAAAYNPDDEEA